MAAGVWVIPINSAKPLDEFGITAALWIAAGALNAIIGFPTFYLVWKFSRPRNLVNLAYTLLVGGVSGILYIPSGSTIRYVVDRAGQSDTTYWTALAKEFSGSEFLRFIVQGVVIGGVYWLISGRKILLTTT
jgi:hypothetical protein